MMIPYLSISIDNLGAYKMRQFTTYKVEAFRFLLL